MKKLLITLITITCVIFSMSAQQLRKGILFGGGSWGNIDAKANPVAIYSLYTSLNISKASYLDIKSLYPLFIVM